MRTLSVIILTLNEEKNITECVQSVRWADQILVVDSLSTDGTVRLAQEAGATVLSIPWEGYGTTKNKALEKATGEWILWLDADERVTAELSDEIRGLLEAERMTYDGFDVARRAYFLGKWIRHCGWYPGRVTRLFRKQAGRFTTTAVHETVQVDGATGSLKHDLIHLTDPDLDRYFLKFNRYTSLAVDDLVRKGIRASVSQLIVKPAFAFFKMYIVRQGWRDGIHGLVLCVVSAGYVFVKYAKLWERELQGGHKG